MPRKPTRAPRPSEIVLDELDADARPWDLDEHLQGCLAAYQIDPSYGTAVYFALEALWGVARDVEVQAETGQLDPGRRDDDWTIPPTVMVPVPWIWVSALAAAWSKYQNEGGPLGHAFGLEGGQGKDPVTDKLAQMLDERAIARWIGSRAQEVRGAGKKAPIETAIQAAAEKFGKSDVTIRRAWSRFGRFERQRTGGT